MPRLPLLLCLTLPTLACSTLNLQRPTATVTGMSVGAVTAQGFTMNFDVDVANPNAVALPLAAADYQLAVGGAKLLDGKTKPQASLPASASRTIQLPVSVTFENLLAAERTIASTRGNVPYDFTGALTFDTGVPLLGQMRVPLQHTGTLALSDILQNPKALLASDAAKRLAKMLMQSYFGK